MQLIDFSVSKTRIAPWKLCSAPPYGNGFKMNFWLFSVFFLVLCCTFAAGEYSGELCETQLSSLNSHTRKFFFLLIRENISVCKLNV